MGNNVEIRAPKRAKPGKLVDIVTIDNESRGSEVIEFNPDMGDLDYLSWLLERAEDTSTLDILDFVKTNQSGISIRDTSYSWDQIAHIIDPYRNLEDVELDDGGVVEAPDSEGTIRMLDQHGNSVGVWEKGETEYTDIGRTYFPSVFGGVVYELRPTPLPLISAVIVSDKVGGVYAYTTDEDDATHIVAMLNATSNVTPEMIENDEAPHYMLDFDPEAHAAGFFVLMNDHKMMALYRDNRMIGYAIQDNEATKHMLTVLNGK